MYRQQCIGISNNRKSTEQTNKSKDTNRQKKEKKRRSEQKKTRRSKGVPLCAVNTKHNLAEHMFASYEFHWDELKHTRWSEHLKMLTLSEHKFALQKFTNLGQGKITNL